jgi:hypothetical protein
MLSEQRIVSALISVVALVGAVTHAYCPSIKVDFVTLGLLALAALPWLSSIFKRIEVPGIGTVEYQDRKQGTSAPVAPSAPTALAPPVVGDPDARKVIATLWRYQKQHAADNPNVRWTFALAPNAPSFPEYLRGIAQLVSLGLAAVSPENHQSMLTNEGIRYCSENDAEIEQTDFYAF